MQSRPRNAAAVPFAAAPFLLAGAVVLAVMAWVWSRLPAQMGVHFGPDGTADRFMSRPVLLVLTAVLFIGLAAWLGFLAYRDGIHGGALTGGSAATAMGLGYVFASLLLVNTDVADAEGLRFPWWHGAIAITAAAVVGVATWRLLPAPAPARTPGPGHGTDGGGAVTGTELPTVGLRPGEVAVWQRTLGPAWLTVTSAAVAVGAVAAWLAGVSPSVARWVAPIGLVVLLASSARVTVDVYGLAVRPPLLPLRVLGVPLKRVLRAEAREVRPVRDLGGWGYRVLPGRWGLALFSGTGVWVDLVGGSQFVVVTRDAKTAAELLNDLAAREKC